MSEKSPFTRMPAALRRSTTAWAASATPGLCWAMGSTMTWMGATRGGSTRPLLSPWVIISPPMTRVDMPQLVSKGAWSLFSLSEKAMPKALAKPSPK